MSKVIKEEFRLCRGDVSGLYEVVGVFYDVNLACQAGRILSCQLKEDLFVIQYIDGCAISISLSSPLRIDWQREYSILRLGVL